MPRAIVAAGARLAADVEVGPYTVIGAEVVIGPRTWIGPHAVINGHTSIGADNRIFQFASIGEAPQDKKYDGESDAARDRRSQRDPRVLHHQPRHGRSSTGVTRIGNDNLFMAYTHVAHDCMHRQQRHHGESRR